MDPKAKGRVMAVVPGKVCSKESWRAHAGTVEREVIGAQSAQSAEMPQPIVQPARQSP